MKPMQPTTKNEILAIISTYEGLLAQCNDGVGSEPYTAALDKWEAELAKLEA